MPHKRIPTRSSEAFLKWILRTIIRNIIPFSSSYTTLSSERPVLLNVLTSSPMSFTITIILVILNCDRDTSDLIMIHHGALYTSYRRYDFNVFLNRLHFIAFKRQKSLPTTSLFHKRLLFDLNFWCAYWKCRIFHQVVKIFLEVS